MLLIRSNRGRYKEEGGERAGSYTSVHTTATTTNLKSLKLRQNRLEDNFSMGMIGHNDKTSHDNLVEMDFSESENLSSIKIQALHRQLPESTICFWGDKTIGFDTYRNLILRSPLFGQCVVTNGRLCVYEKKQTIIAILNLMRVVKSVMR